MKVLIYPEFSGEDKGDGGVRQVVEGQRSALPEFGIELVDDPEQADLLAIHILAPPVWLDKYRDKAIVAHCHGLYWSEYDWSGKGGLDAEHWAYKANAGVMELIRVADIVTSPSEWVSQAIRRHTMRDVRTVPHGVKPLKPGKSQGYVLWNKTRPDPVCDPEPLNRLAMLMPDVQFRSTFGADLPNLTITGRLPHAQALEEVSNAGVYLATSRETFGIGTLEALSAGVPVVGYRWGGQREFIDHGVDGWLVEPGDIAGLAEGVEWALKDRDKTAPTCRAKAAGFSWRAACEQYAAIYREAVEKRASAALAPRVSVIVPAYGLEKYLPETLQSVAASSMKDFECIVVDDASPDRCGAIADEWAAKDPRFKVVHNQTNQYLAEARNTGIAASTGRYILPLDADDTLPANALEIMATALDGDRHIDIAYGGVEFVEEAEGNRRWHSEWPTQFRLDWQLKGPGQLLPYASLYRRRVWELTGGYRARCRSSEDQDFWLRTTSYGFQPKKVTDADCLIYRNRAGSMSDAEGWREHRGWYPWVKDLSLAPAGAGTPVQLPIPTCDPPAIAVIIPVGPGHERLVLDAIDSVDAQTFRQWECIVINDTGAPLRHLPSWVRVIDTTGQVGPAQARNTGIFESLASLFLPLDADDYLQPDALRVMHGAHRRTGDIVYADFWEDPKEEGRFTPWALPDYQPEKLISHGALHAVTALTPKSVWEKVGGYDATLPGWEDWGFQLAAADKGFCSRRIGAPIWTYRKHTGTRREDNFANFEESKAGILSRFKDFWSGGKLPMACSSCAKRATIVPPAVAQSFAMAAPQPQTNEAVVRVQYTGPIVGRRRYKGESGTIYSFDAGEPPKWVLERDYNAFFALREDFELIPAENAPSVSISEGPALVAEGPPVR